MLFSCAVMNSARQKKYFDSTAKYNLTKGFLKKISSLPKPHVVDFMMDQLKEFLCREDEDRAARWLTKYWSGERGRFSQGHAGYGCPANNNGEESNWGRMKKLIPNSSPYYVFMSACMNWIRNKCRDDESQLAALTDSPFLPNEPILGRDIWRDVRKLTVSDLRNWTVLSHDNMEWHAMLDRIEPFIAAHNENSLARAIVTWNSTHDQPLMPKEYIGIVCFPTQAFLSLLGKGYNFNEGREAQKELAFYNGVMVTGATSMVRLAHDMELEYILNNTQYFHHARILNSPWAKHAKWCCTCKDCFKNCICVHSLILSLMSDKIEIPEMLDERQLARSYNAKKQAREFAGACRAQECERERELIFKVFLHHSFSL